MCCEGDGQAWCAGMGTALHCPAHRGHTAVLSSVLARGEQQRCEPKGWGQNSPLWWPWESAKQAPVF